MGKNNNSKKAKKPQLVVFEEEIEKFWQDNDTFKKSVELRPIEKNYIFYDGPPFATGLPHYGHIVGQIMKDMVPRHWTMRGHRVERRWGWDCHGLPIENLIEKELGLNSKQEIEEYGIAKFNEACRSTVLKYADEWKVIIPRAGRWVDMENDYKTMDIEFMESVWWVFRQLWDKDLVYEGHKSMHICPRCVTPISNFEVSQGYEDVKDLSVIAKFAINNGQEKLDQAGDLFMLAWTTTPWTLPGNALLAVGPEVDYVLVEHDGAHYILAKSLVPGVFKDKDHSIVRPLKVAELAELTYDPLFPYFADTKNAFRVVVGDFVSTNDGTGIVHIAPAFGEDDYQIGQREEIELIQHVTMDGHFTEDVTEFAGMEVKPKDDRSAADVEMIKWLAKNERLFSKAKYEHSYPHCWRCDTPLLNYATSSWFVQVSKFKQKLIDNNKKINWIPEHIKEGRFGKWLENARDWSISRNRYWGTPLPIWRSEDGDLLCIGSVAELEELSGEKVTDLHKHKVDDIVIKKDGKEYHRIPEVLDTWFDSGSMPYGQLHYPHENKEKFEAGFPAEFIAEGQDQTRGWFYVLHVLSSALTLEGSPSIDEAKDQPAFRNVIVNGIVLAEDGKKMSKRLQNYPDPMELIGKYGADALRYYLATSPVMEAENLNFREKDVDEIYKKYVNTLWNVFTFFQMFNDDDSTGTTGNSEITDPEKVENVLDKWILSKLHGMIADITEGYDTYHLRQASRPLLDFVQELSTWYVRRSRDRFKGDDEADREQALNTLHTVLMTLVKLAAPVTPFITEKIYQELRAADSPESVHHCDWPAANKDFVNEKIESAMEQARVGIEKALALRAEAGLKVRQPLQSATLAGDKLYTDIKELIKDELNVKEVKFGKEYGIDTELTEELKLEGSLRELIRQTNSLRKKAKLSINDLVDLKLHTESEVIKQVLEKYGEEYKKNVLAKSVSLEAEPQNLETKVNDEELTISL